MALNPYEAPIESSTLDDFKRQNVRRPRGVTLYCLLVFLQGIVLIASPLFMPGTTSFSTATAFSWLLIPLMVTGGLYIATAIGSWRRRNWGWWLCLFTCCLTVVRNAGTVFRLALAGGVNPKVMSGLMEQSVLRMFVFGLVAAYFFRDSVRAYFGTSLVNPIVALTSAIVASLLTTVGLHLLLGLT